MCVPFKHTFVLLTVHLDDLVLIFLDLHVVDRVVCRRVPGIERLVGPTDSFQTL